jgi:hypothetical protein
MRYRLFAVLLLLVALNASAQKHFFPRAPGPPSYPGRNGGPPVGHQERRHPKFTEIPLPSPKTQWVRVDTTHFVVLGSTTERTTRTIAQDLEKLASLLATTTPFFQMPARPTFVFVFSDSRELMPYLDAISGLKVDVNGLTVRHPDGGSILVDAEAYGGGLITARHELVHGMLHRETRPLPLWIEEGLAEYYSNNGLPRREHVIRLRGRAILPMESLFAARSGSSVAATSDFYAQSWGVVAVLMRRDAKAFFEFTRDLDRGESIQASLQKRYRLTPEDVKGLLRHVGAPAPPIIAAAIEVPTFERHLAYGELLGQLAITLARTVGKEKEAERHFRAAMKALPDDPEIRLLYAQWLSIDECRSEEALAAIDGAVAAGAGERNSEEAVATVLRRVAARMPAATRADLQLQAEAYERVHSPDR